MKNTRRVAFACLGVGWLLSAGAQAQNAQGGRAGKPGASGSPAPQTYKGLEVAITAVERASSAVLNDCPPGANTVKGMTKPGEEFAIVTATFKVSPSYQQMALKRPVLYDVAGKTYNTAVSFVDVGKIPEFSCAFPFRVSSGTQLKSLQIETLSFNLTLQP